MPIHPPPQHLTTTPPHPPRYLDDNYPIRDINGTKIPLASHQFPPYLSVTVSLNRLHTAVNRFRPSRELTVDEERELMVKVRRVLNFIFYVV